MPIAKLACPDATNCVEPKILPRQSSIHARTVAKGGSRNGRRSRFAVRQKLIRSR